MRLFISYARVDKQYGVRIADVLSVHNVWYDQRLYAGQNWWSEILRRLDWCDALIYLLSPDSVESEYCQREFEIVKSLAKPIIPILIHKDVEIPDYLSDLQYIDMSDEITADSVKVLLDTIYFVEHEMPVRVSANGGIGRFSGVNNRFVDDDDDDSDMIVRAVTAMKSGNYDQAVFLLNRCIDLGIDPQFFNLEMLLREAEHGLGDLIKQRDIQRNYERIRQLIDFATTKRLGVEAFQRFHMEHPNYDPNNLNQICLDYLKEEDSIHKLKRNGNSVINTRQKSASIVVQPEWRKIPVGVVRVDQDPENHIYVDKFYISKYPITNAHYQVFINDPKGYNNISWWNFCGAATESRLKHPISMETEFKGQNRPRENVNWYDAIAFCRWVSKRSKRRITLPTLAQRQRAIQGDDDRVFPWGNKFEPEFCNSQDNELRMTTVVNRYEQGASPYKVHDLVGNVWEWCLDDTDTDDDGDDSTLELASKRIVHGGSYLSGSERCHIAFRYILPAQTLFGSIGFRVVLLPD